MDDRHRTVNSWRCALIGVAAGVASFAALLAVLFLRLPTIARGCGFAAAAIIVAIAVSWPTASVAHGDHAWINEQGYKAANGTHCCGWSDCLELALADVRETPAGWETPYGAVDKRGVYHSRDGRVWVCRRHHRGATPQGSCLFIPGGG
jgi:hypothetical protein